jgi:hypothetical protein
MNEVRYGNGSFNDESSFLSRTIQQREKKELKLNEKVMSPLERYHCYYSNPRMHVIPNYSPFYYVHENSFSLSSRQFEERRRVPCFKNS